MKRSRSVRRLVGCILACAGLVGCATATGVGGGHEAAAVIVDPPAPAGARTLLIAMPSSPTFLDVRKSLVSELGRSFRIETFVVVSSTTPDEIGNAVARAKPACVVLMNNATMGLVSAYEHAHPDRAVPPTVLLMASLIEGVQPTLKNSTGIAYEVPGVTAFVNLRAIVNIPIRRVGVAFRPALRRFVERQRVLATTEKIQLVPIAVPNDVTAEGLRDALESLVKDGHVDAIWMLNDNALVRDARFRDDAWRVALGDRLPLIVGAANLVNPASPLGTIAVVPDHEALGLQAANLIFELADDGWKVQSHPTELPLSVKTVVDIRSARDHFGLRVEALKHIDRPME